eukprot:CAMPEP_0172646164 /NCGR_PEP_ID=MMETSP1068-20121228/240100_1 /TAXON_ID=35684 /ORGANISM="Pseudopedinella elastica, Strain CCMP716" /LENGTH=348 /DNA_ID=CAMNT_0013460417 /DNA_START=167 /DNA_END=1213 /DNA_ORIENTATION=+
MASAASGGQNSLPLFSGASILNAAAGQPADLDNLDFQLLNDYLFDEQSGGYDGSGAQAMAPPKARGAGGAGGGGRGGAPKKKVAAPAAVPRAYDEEEDDDELEDLGSSDDEDDGTGKRRKKDAAAGDGRPKTQQQIDRRRERNRILARRTRLRKKFFFESLQKQVSELQRENVVLKDIVKLKMGDVATGILSQCNTDLSPIVTDSTNKATELLAQSDYKLMATLQAAQRSFVITDPYLPDNPIVFASRAFLDSTGYTMEQVLGRNCRFLQGPKTDRRKVDLIRQGIAEGSDTTVCLLNYRADGSTFWNQFFVAALRDGNKRIVNYVGVQCPVSKPAPDDMEYEDFMKE